MQLQDARVIVTGAVSRLGQHLAARLVRAGAAVAAGDIDVNKLGELARGLAKRDIKYLGRIDQQVKIRSFRIEFGAIETELASYPGVRKSVVMINSDQSCEKRLIAYIVLHTRQDVTRAELYFFRKERLPEYMVAATFVIMEQMPLTSNGAMTRGRCRTPIWHATNRKALIFHGAAAGRRGDYRLGGCFGSWNGSGYLGGFRP